MRGLLSEYLLKGVFLGLLLFVATQEPDWATTGLVAVTTLGGLVFALAIAGLLKIREGYQIQGRLGSFILFLLLESPKLIYGGILLGISAGALWVRRPESDTLLTILVLAGAGLGVVFWLLLQWRHRWGRIGLSLALAGALVAGVLFWLQEHPDFMENPAAQTMFGIRLLLGIPMFYLLTFAGMSEESEFEIGAICAALGLASWTLGRPAPTFQSLALLVPAMLYLVYTVRILPGLRIFKHVVRGISHAKVGKVKPALGSFRRALQLDPENKLARESLWKVHRSLDLNQILADPQIMAMMDLEMCLERAKSLLLASSPTSEKLHEAHRLLDLVITQQPAHRPTVDYWKAVAFTHARDFDRAVEALEHVLNPDDYAPKDPPREAVLVQSWQLALFLHPELKRRVGTPQLAIPGRRMEAIGAVERFLAANANDPDAWNLKQLLYADLTEAEYKTAGGPEGPAPDFDHAYVHQLGMASINDSSRWQRGIEFLRLAARGMLPQAPTMFLQIAQVLQRESQLDAIWQYYELAKRAGQSVGPKNLGDADKQAYFNAVKLLADQARAQNDLDAAIENYQLYSESNRSGLETLRLLTDLHEKKGNVFAALWVTEQALLYDPKDKDLLARKDRYYFSIMPDDLRSRLEAIRPAFDLNYCCRKARSLLDAKDADLDVIEWAQHLAELAQVVQPDNLTAKLLRSRALRRRGEIDAARTLLEEIYAKKPESFASREEEDSWYLACRLLGEAYLYEVGRPDLAVPCFNDFRKSAKSGADTLYKLGQAYEQLGDPVRAAKCYENVTSYQGHPLVPDAEEGLRRVRTH